MSKSLAPVLHLDIIENIVDILFKDDAEGLQYVKTFSLTCQSFFPLCRKYIFASIRIQVGKPRSSRRTDETLQRLLLKTPAIAKYVRHLSILIIYHPPSKSRHSLDQVGQQLTRLKSLAISLWHPTLTKWSCIPSSMLCSVTNLIHLPTVRRLRLGSMGIFPIFDLLTCANLKYISIDNLHITTEHDPAALQDPTGEIFGKAQQLRDITLDGKEILNLWFTG